MNHESEMLHAVRVAHKVLDRHSVDPDADLVVLARQLIRAHEAANALHKIASGFTGLLEGVLGDSTTSDPVVSAVMQTVREASDALESMPTVSPALLNAAAGEYARVCMHGVALYMLCPSCEIRRGREG